MTPESAHCLLLVAAGVFAVTVVAAGLIYFWLKLWKDE